MELVIVGEFDSDNVGDQLIGEGHAAIFSSHGNVRILPLEPTRKTVDLHNRSGARISRAGNFKSLHRTLYQSSTLYRHMVETCEQIIRWKAYRMHSENTIADADMLIVGGGQLLSDGTLRMLYRIYHLTEVAQARGIPVVVFGTGLTPGRTFVSRRILICVLRNLGSTNYFRDSASMSAARQAVPSIALSAEATPDCAIAGISNQQAIDPGAALVGIAPMSPTILARLGVSTHRIDEWWIDIITRLVINRERPVLFSTGVSLDMEYAASLQSRLAEKGFDIELLRKPTRPDELLEDLRSMKRILAQRLHASIAYYALGGLPASATWDTKVNEFYSRISLPGRIFEIGEGDPEVIARALVSPGQAGVAPSELSRISYKDGRDCVNQLSAVNKGVALA
ncbi:polysaccharide pyruvyl transferase family protein [Luteimonas fraxinea]|uniref:Polysaccharide pyruvyl transferase family protein n=1 Tax=Luteimonas fraxinea TaxID=2901869 RepID=A0ABS8UEL3_9GAMM|nr:polysaccharide pyruvyl transferase family protein [Luteimonas fraxinea]MCD9097674.1 polysaccharide pyruvyl transferase family protein [Luteimonas fraxinea]MCD9124784.1 polysaccharide pyruvyl transferase family protein [Luteimonas fraxinea]UHH08573.1 polysaccharide pyruvyl transferase family protein [Luteimonas fraxinea]